MTAQGWDAATTEVKAAKGDRTLHLHEEELRETKERVQTGEVRLGKEVVEARKTVDVPVTHDEVYVERRPLDRRKDDSPIEAGESEAVRVPVSEERVDVEKQTVLAEEVRVGTRPVTETRQVSDTVKREEARIEQTGDVAVAGAGAAASASGGWAEAMPRYRADWQRRSGASGGSWEEAEPGYRYGYEMASDPRYRGRAWSDAEPELRRDWAARHPETPWDRASAAIRAAWDGVTNR